MRRKVWKLKEHDVRENLEKRVRKLITVDAPDLWNCFKEGVLRACDEVCGKTRGKSIRGDT